MSAKKFLFGALALLALAFGFGLTSPRVQAENDAVAVVQGFYDAVNAGNLQQATEYYADTFIGISPAGRYIGKTDGSAGLAGAIKDGIKFELSNFKDAGGHVVYTYKVLMGDSVIDSGDNGLTIVRDGKIVFDGITNTEKEWATAVVHGYYDAYNAGDLDQAVKYLADDVVFINPTGTYQGKAQARENLQAIQKDGLTFFLSNFKDDNGRVTYAYQVKQNGQPIENGDGGLTIVKNGLIVFDGTVETEKQLPQVKAETPLPTTGVDMTSNVMWGVALAGLLLLALGALLVRFKRA